MKIDNAWNLYKRFTQKSVAVNTERDVFSSRHKRGIPCTNALPVNYTETPRLARHHLLAAYVDNEIINISMFSLT